jgi:hypothetical protein
MRPLLRRPSPAMIVALIALFVATAGAGVAATVIDGKNLKNRSVSAPKLQNGSVRAAQLATGAVTTTTIKAKAVTAGKLAAGAVGTDQLAAGAVRAADLGAGAVGTPQIAAGAVANAAIANGAVTEGRIANGAVSRAKLTADAQLPAVVVRRSAPVGVPNGTIGTATASCQPGERATGGGALPASAPTALTFALGDGPVPSGDGDVPTGWVGYLLNNDMGTAQLVAYAVCARAG